MSSKSSDFLSRPLRLLVIWGSVLLFAFCFWSATEARKKTSNRVVDWLPKGTKELEVFEQRYCEHFPEGEYLMALWKDCDINDRRLDIVADLLTVPPDGEILPYFAEAMTTRSVIDMLTDAPTQLGTEAAKSRLARWLIGQDLKTACLVLVPHPEGLQRPDVAIEFLFETIKQVTGLERSDIYVAGPSIDSVAIDEISAKSQQTLVPFFLLFSLFLLLCCLRHNFAAFIVFWVAVLNEELANALLFWATMIDEKFPNFFPSWFEAHVDSVSMLTSSLVYVLTISGSVHLINYYRRTLDEMNPGETRDAPMQTFSKAILPCSLSAFTTILGMGSLAISKMVPIKTFGIFASLALFLGTVWFFLFILSVLQERPVRRWLPTSEDTQRPMRARKQTIDNFWERFGLFVFHCRYPITVLTFLSLIFFAFGIKELRTSISFHGLLPHDAKVLQDYRMLEDKFGGLIPIEVVVHFPDENGANKKMLDQLYFLASLVDELRQTEDVDATISVLNFLPHLPRQYGGGFRTVSERAGMESMLNRSQERLHNLRFFDVVEGGDEPGYYWRISLRVSTQKELDYAVMIKAVEERLEKVRKQREDMNIENVQFNVTGGVPLVFRAQEMLLWDLIYSFMVAFCLLALTMMIVLRGVVRGMLAMIPNLFPCVIVFGMLGLCDIPVDMGSMMTASVALGISLDGTLHLMTWVNIGLRRAMCRKNAVLFALQRCSTALTQTIVICGVGMLIFGLSDFVPVARFAIMLCVLLVISLAGTIIVLPAILYSPLGRFFEGTGKEKARTLVPGSL